MSDEAPTFIACGARSGSTLLRWLIDSHPEVACPGETDVAQLLNSYVDTATALAGKVDDNTASARSLEDAREVVDGLMDGYLSPRGKSRWCDKSLSNALHLDLLASAWPQSRFVLLHRHAMDFVISGIEASPWGLAGYSFAQFAPMSPTDTVVALIAYWIDRTTKLLNFEQANPGRCLRVRYEDLVTRTDEVMDGIWDHIGVARVKDVDLLAFATNHDAYGPADYKVWYTKAVHGKSVGRGARVPPGHVSGAVRSGVNDLLSRLGYTSVDDNWGCGGAGPSHVTSQPTSSGDGAGGADASGAGGALEPSHDSLVVELRILEGHVTLWRGMVDLSSCEWSDKKPGDVPTTRIVAVESSALAGICAGAENIGTALRVRTVRYYGPLLRNFEGERGIFERLGTFLSTHAQELVGPTGPLALAFGALPETPVV